MTPFIAVMTAFNSNSNDESSDSAKVRQQVDDADTDKGKLSSLAVHASLLWPDVSFHLCPTVPL